MRVVRRHSLARGATAQCSRAGIFIAQLAKSERRDEGIVSEGAQGMAAAST
jgi:hypothetical protein